MSCSEMIINCLYSSHDVGVVRERTERLQVSEEERPQQRIDGDDGVRAKADVTALLIFSTDSDEDSVQKATRG